MSETIDSKVVEMRFDNKNFESNVKESMSTLDKLKSELKFDGASKGLENIEKAAKQVDLSSLVSSVEKLEDRFSSFGIVGKRVLENITDSVMSLTKKTLNFLTDGTIQGGIRRAMNLENAHFQLQGLLKDEKEVSAVMKNVNDSVDGTAYSLDAAAKVAAQLTASGMKAGDEMYESLRAVAGVAAMTNSEYEDIGRIFTTVAGNGRVMGEQLQQLSHHGMNAAAALTNYINGVNDGSIKATEHLSEFDAIAKKVIRGDYGNGAYRKKALEAAGYDYNKVQSTVNSLLGIGDAAKSSVLETIKTITEGKQITEATLRELVHDGKISFELFSAAMDEAFGEHAKEANKTFEGSMANVKSALARIGAGFISPLVVENGALVQLLNSVRVRINEIKKALVFDSEIGNTEALSKRFTDTIIKIANALTYFVSTVDLQKPLKIFYNAVDSLINIFRGLDSVVRVIYESFIQVFPPIAIDKIVEFSEKIKELTANFKLSEDQAKTLKSIFVGLFSALNLVKNAVVLTFNILKPVMGLIINLSGVVLKCAASIADALGKIIAKINEFITKYKPLEMIFNGAVFILNTFVDFIKLIYKAIKYSPIGDYVVIIKNKLSSLLSVIGEIILNIQKIDHSKVEEIVRKIRNVVYSGTVNIINSLISLWNIGSNILNRFTQKITGLSIGEIFTKIYNKLLDSFNKIREIFGNFGSISMSGISTLSQKTEKAFEPIDNKFSGFKNFLVKLWEGIKLVSAYLITKAKIIIPTITEIFVSVGSVISAIISAIGNTLKNLNIEQILDIINSGVLISLGISFKKFLDSITGINKSIGGFLGGITDALNGIKGCLQSYQKDLKASYIMKIAISIGILAGSLWVLSTIDWDKLLWGLAGLSAIGIGLLKLFKSVNKSSSKDGSFEFIDNVREQFASFKTQTQDPTKVLLSIAGSILILAIALKTLSKIEPGQLLLSLGVIEALLFTMTSVIKRLSKEQGSLVSGIKGIIFVAIAIKALVKPIEKLGKMPIDQLAIGLVAVVGMLFALTIAMRFLEDKDVVDGAAGILICAVALRLLTKPLIKLSKLEPEKLGQSLVALVVMLGSVVLALTILKKNDSALSGATAILICSAALLVFAATLKVLSKISTDDISKGLVAIAGVFIILGIAGYALKPVVSVIFALGGALLMMGGAALLFGAGIYITLKAFDKFSGSIVKFSDAMIAAIINLVTAIPQIFKALAKSLIDAIPYGVEILVTFIKSVVMGIYESKTFMVDTFISMILTILQSIESKIQIICETLVNILLLAIKGLSVHMPELITETAKLFKIIVDGVLKVFANYKLEDVFRATAFLTEFAVLAGLLAGISLELAGTSALLLPMAKNLNKFIEDIKPFLKAIQEIDEKSLIGAKNLAEMIFIFTATNILEALTSWFTGGTSLKDFGKELVDFAPYLMKYQSKINGINAEEIEKSAVAASALVGVVNAIPRTGGWLQKVIGDHSLSKLTEEMVDFGTNLKTYGTVVDGLNAEAINNSIDPSLGIIKILKDLPRTGGLLQDIIGEHSLSKFAEELALFGPSLKKYGKTVDNLNAEAINNSIKPSIGIITMMKQLPKTGGIVQDIIGEHSLSKFAEELALFGPSLKKYGKSIRNLDYGSVLMSILPAKMLISLINDLPNTGGWLQKVVGENSLAAFGEEMVQFAGWLRKYGRIVSKIDSQSVLAITATAIPIQALLSVADNIPSTGGILKAFTGKNSLSKFGKELVAFAPHLKKYGKEVNGLNTFSISESIEPVKALITMASELQKLGNIGGVFQAIAGERVKLGDFGEQLAAFAPNLWNYAGDIQGINYSAINKSIEPVKALITMASELQKLGNIGGVFQVFAGKKYTLKDFGAQLEAFAPQLSSYTDYVEGLNSGAIDKSIPPVKALIEMAADLSKLGTRDGIFDIFSGGNYTLSDFGVQLEAFAPHLFEFGKKMSEADKEGYFPAIYKSVENIVMLLEASSDIPDIKSSFSWVEYGKKLASFGEGLRDYGENVKELRVLSIKNSIEPIKLLLGAFKDIFGTEFKFALTEYGYQLASFGKDLNQYGENVSELKIEQINTSIDEVNKLIDMIKGMDGIDFTKVTKFEESLSELGEKGVDGFIGNFELSSFKIATAISKMIKGFTEAIDKEKDPIMRKGEFIANQILEGLKNKYLNMYYKGSQFVQGFVDGINDNLYKVENASGKIGQMVLDAIDKSLDIHSPSREAYKKGNYTCLGFVNAFKDYTSKAFNAGNILAKSATSGIDRAISQISDIIFNDVDSQPTIRPVLDLTDIQNGTNTLNNMMSDIGAYDLSASISSATLTAGRISARQLAFADDSNMPVSATVKIDNLIGNIEGNVDAETVNQLRDLSDDIMDKLTNKLTREFIKLGHKR